MTGTMKKLVACVLVVVIASCAACCVSCASKDEETAYRGTVTYYSGNDPWGEQLVVCVDIMTNNITYIEELDDDHILVDMITLKIVDGATEFSVEEKWDDLEAHYSGKITLDNDCVIVTFEDGQMTTISEDGGGAAHMVGVLKENGNNAVLIDKR